MLGRQPRRGGQAELEVALCLGRSEARCSVTPPSAGHRHPLPSRETCFLGAGSDQVSLRFWQDKETEGASGRVVPRAECNMAGHFVVNLSASGSQTTAVTGTASSLD